MLTLISSQPTLINYQSPIKFYQIEEDVSDTTYPPHKENEKQTQINQTKMTRCPNPLISINITYVKVPNQSLLDKRKRK
jgi:hypothetical protein